MNDKRRIDAYRREIVRLRFNLEQISFDMQTLPPDYGDLLDEHDQHVRRIRILEDDIEKMQPTWRKWLGVLY